MTTTNENGFSVSTFTYSSDKSYVTEGQVIGFTIGWIVGIVTLYIAGMCIIRQYFIRKARHQFSSSSSDQPRRNPSSNSSDPPAKPLEQIPGRRPEEIINSSKPRRKQYEDNPTLQQIQLTQQGYDSTNKRVHEDQYRGATINLDQRVERTE